MTKKNVGLARNKVIRVQERVLQDINSMKKDLGMGARHNENDVIAELVKMWKSKKIGDTPFLARTPKIDVSTYNNAIDNFKSLYEDEKTRTLRWKKRFELSCENKNLSQAEIMEMI